jgi:NADP-reducing hydrogenase subunit HndB
MVPWDCFWRTRNTKAILEFIESENLSGVTVRQTGNIGLDSFEPIVQ